MMKNEIPKRQSICTLLLRRERGFLDKTDYSDFHKAGAILADRALLRSTKTGQIHNMTEKERSSYIAEGSSNGLAVTSHTNRCLSIIDTGTMKKIGEITGYERTVWTIAFHPKNTDLIATGNFDGTASVFKEFTLYRTLNFNKTDNKNEAVKSISFHPELDIICFAIENKVIVWNWQENIIVNVLSAHMTNNIKYVKFIPISNMLLTGIKITSHYENVNIDQFVNPNIFTSCTYFLLSLLNLFGIILEDLTFSTYEEIYTYWSKFCCDMIKFSKRLIINDVMIISLLDSSVNHLQNFNFTLELLLSRAETIEYKLSEIYCKPIINRLIYNIDDMLRVLDVIVDGYYRETKYVKNRGDISLRLLKEVFCVFVKIMSLDCTKKRKIFYENQYRLQVWEFQITNLPDLKQVWRNVLTFSYIHNDSSVDISKCGKLVASFREFEPMFYVIEVHSLEQNTFGKLLCRCPHIHNNLIISLSISPSVQLILVGTRSSNIGYFIDCLNGRIYKCLAYDDSSDSISFLKWLPRPGDGIMIGYKSYQLRFVRHF